LTISDTSMRKASNRNASARDMMVSKHVVARV